jgi:hypothetical protein
LGDRRGWCAAGGGDKWSSIFKSVAARDVRIIPHQVADGNDNRSAASSATSHLRHLLEERRLEDRIYDRQTRLRLQRSRLLGTNNINSAAAYYLNDDQEKDQLITNNNSKERHEPGWLLSYESDVLSSLSNNNGRRNENDGGNFLISTTIPSLQLLAANVLGPLLPKYCAEIGSHTVGEALTPVSDAVLAELAISLANNSGVTNTTISDGVVRALVHSGTATKLVFRSGKKHSLFDTMMKEDDENDDGEDDDSRLLSDNGLLSLCPRFAPDTYLVCHNYEQKSRDIDDDDDDNDSSLCNDNDWETLDYDMGLNSRMLGCFHLKRLELVDILLQSSTTASSSNLVGISIVALRTVLRSCSNLTHLSLSGCFSNWETVVATGDHDDISDLLCGNQNISSLTRSVAYLIKLDVNTAHLVPQLMFDPKKYENANWRNDTVAGLDVLLPELKVLDVSHCSWVTPSMIIKYLLSKENDIANDIVYKWEKDVTTAVEIGDATHATRNKRIAATVSPLPQHINVRGCDDGLHSVSQWIDVLKSSYGLFHGIDLSFDRHTIDRRL